MSLLVDTSVWSLALRRDAVAGGLEVDRLSRALTGGELVVTTGIILQELLQGFLGPKNRDEILHHFRGLPTLVPSRSDHVEAADLRNRCRRAGIQVGTIDALIASLCVRHELTLLTTDRDFTRVAELSALHVWGAPSSNLSTR